MNQTSIFEYLDNLKLQITDPTQKQLEYYHNKKAMITSQRQIAIPKFKSPQIVHQEPKFLQLRKTLSQQEFCSSQIQKQQNYNYYKTRNYESRIAFQ
ncbi:unnamed protein product [Paramecium sonneborni]|uniref:Uncharacterized protein n=1 Tax=Paramecium sonneborni TaxID=65129 RepID=A0A8S1MQP1_9CILI|nr:unnamed protein product [Paramecium sonneborni]